MIVELEQLHSYIINGALLTHQSNPLPNMHKNKN